MTKTASFDAPALARPKTPPGPAGNLLFGSLFALRRDSLKLLSESAREYGDIVRLRLVQDVILLNHPDYVKYVLQDNHSNYTKGYMYRRMKPLVGEGLLTSEGDFWRRQRRLAQPAFHKQRIAAFADLMARRTLQMLAQWETVKEGILDVHAEMMKLTFGVVGEALFSVDVGGAAEEVGRALTVALEITNERFQSPLVIPQMVPTLANRRFERAMKILDTTVNRVIQERRKSPDTKGDLLDMFMGARDEESGQTMTDRQLRDEIMTMVLAGHETTANTLSFVFYLLGRAPAITREARQEIQRVAGDRPLTLEDLPQLKCTTRIIEEGMRLYPPAWVFARKAIEEDTIEGYRIPKESTVLLCPYAMHRHPDYWDNPDAFDPDRFTPEASAGRPRFAYYPFAAGPRMCIGNVFAMMEMQIIVASVLRTYSLDLVPGFQLELSPQVTLRPAKGVPVRIRSVARASAQEG